MRYTVFWSAFTVLCLSLLIMFATLFVCAKRGTENVIPQDAKINSEIISEQSNEHKYEYILKENLGKLGVYKKDEIKPIETFNVYINTLPLYDQQQLKNGIQVKNYEELLNLIEDYIS